MRLLYISTILLTGTNNSEAYSCHRGRSTAFSLTVHPNRRHRRRNTLPHWNTLTFHPSPQYHIGSLYAETSTSHHDDAKSSMPPSLIPANILGPPEPLRSLKTGSYLRAFRTLNDKEKQEFTIERAACGPDIFYLRNFVAPQECRHIQTMARDSCERKQAETVSRVDDVAVRRNCMVAWISSVAAEASAAEVLSSLPQTELKNDSSGSGGDNDSHSPSDNYSGSYNIVSNLVASTTNIFLSQPILAHPSAGVEDLQVLEYGVGGEFVFHHDGEPRILTVIYYLNGVGGTWFPLASVGDNADGINGKERVNNHHCVEQPKNKPQAMELIKDLIPGNDGLLVKGGDGEQQQQQLQSSSSKDDHVVWINKGDAIAFYNYLDDGSARLDWRSIHCGLPTTKEDGTKWIANHWYRLNVLEQDDNN